MYDELVNALRHCAECDHQGCAADCRFGKEHPLNFICIEYLQHEAADAIEDLENKLNLWRQGKINRWIPVTERFPKDRQRVLVFYWLDVKPKQPRHQVCYFASNLSKVDKYDFDGCKRNG